MVGVFFDLSALYLLRQDLSLYPEFTSYGSSSQPAFPGFPVSAFQMQGSPHLLGKRVFTKGESLHQASSRKKNPLNYLLIFNCMSVLPECTSVYHVHAWCQGNQEAVDPVVLEPQTAVSCRVGTRLKLGSSGSAASTYLLVHLSSPKNLFLNDKHKEERELGVVQEPQHD